MHCLPVVVRRYKIFYLHLLEFAAAEYEVARGNLVPERLAYLRYSEGNFYAGCVADIFKVGENALRGFGAEICYRGFVAQRANVGLKHQIEVARRSQGSGFACGGGGYQIVLVGLGVHIVL